MEEAPTPNTNPLGENEIETYVELIDSEDLYAVKITRKKNDIIFKCSNTNDNLNEVYSYTLTKDELNKSFSYNISNFFDKLKKDYEMQLSKKDNS